jgi:hypothetical protein
MRRRQFSNRMGANPMGNGDDVLSGATNTNVLYNDATPIGKYFREINHEAVN